MTLSSPLPHRGSECIAPSGCNCTESVGHRWAGALMLLALLFLILESVTLRRMSLKRFLRHTSKCDRF